MSIFVVTAKTVEAINGVRERGCWDGIKAMPTQDGVYQLVTLKDGAVMATVDENAGTITYAQESAANG